MFIFEQLNHLLLNTTAQPYVTFKSLRLLLRWLCHKIVVVIDMPPKLDMSAAPVATHWRPVEDPPTAYHQDKTRVCAVKLDKAQLKEEAPYTLPDSTTGPEETQEPNEEGMADHASSSHVGVTVVHTSPNLIRDVIKVAFIVTVGKGIRM